MRYSKYSPTICFCIALQVIGFFLAKYDFYFGTMIFGVGIFAEIIVLLLLVFDANK
jgi:hypothetical protein